MKHRHPFTTATVLAAVAAVVVCGVGPAAASASPGSSNGSVTTQPGIDVSKVLNAAIAGATPTTRPPKTIPPAARGSVLEAAVVSAATTGSPLTDVPGLRTKYTTTDVNPNGTYTKKVSPTPVNVEQADGTFLPIDTTLRSVAGSPAPVRSALGTLLGGAGSSRLATLSIAGHQVTLGATAGLHAPTLSGATATYPGAVPGGDLRVTDLNNGVELAVVLPKRPLVPPTSWDFPIDLGGLTAVKAQGGQSFALHASDGSLAGTVSGVFVKDSTVPVPHLDGFAQDIVSTPAGSVLRITPDAGYLAAPTTTYPVVVDPTITEQDSTDGDDTFIWSQSAQQNTDWGGDPWLYAGTWTDGSVSRALINFPNQDWNDSGDTIQSATLALSNADSYACQTSGNAPRMAIQRVQNRDVDQHTTWASDVNSSDPIIGTDVSALYDSYSEPKGCPISNLPGDYIGFDFTGPVQGWASGSYPNDGIQLITAENNVYSFRQFRSGDASGATADGYAAGDDGQPILQVTYHSPQLPPVQDVTTLVPHDGQVQLGWTPESGTTQQNQPDSYLVAVYDADNAQLLGTSTASGGTTSLYLQGYTDTSGNPASVGDGQNLTFYVYAHDDNGYASPGQGMTTVVQGAPSAVYGPDGNPSTPPSVTATDTTVTGTWTQGNLDGARSLSQYVAFLYTQGQSWPSAATAYCVGLTTPTVTFGPGAPTGNCAGGTPAEGTNYTVEVFEQNQSGDSYQGGPDTSGTALPAGFGPPATSAGALVGTVPDAPTQVAETPGNGYVGLSWTAPDDTHGSPVTSSTAYVYETDDDSLVTEASLQGSGTSLYVGGLTNDFSYYAEVTSSNSFGESTQSDPSNAVVGQGPPLAPTGVSATAGAGDAVVSWTDGGENGSAVNGRSIQVIGSNGSVVKTVAAAGSPTLVQGLNEATQYTFAVADANADGTGAATSSNSATTLPGTILTAPSKPTAAATAGSVVVSWTAPLLATSGSTTYDVRLFDATTLVQTAETTTTGLSAQLPATNGEALLATIRPTNLTGNLGEDATTGTVTPMGVPDAVNDASATSDGSGDVDVSWTEPYAEGNDIADYTVTASPGGAYYAVDGSTNDVDVTGLSSGTQYTFTVTAENDLGSGPAISVGPIDPGTTDSVDSDDSAGAQQPDALTTQKSGAQAITADNSASSTPSVPSLAPGAPDIQNTHDSAPAYTRSYYMTDVTGTENYDALVKKHGCSLASADRAGVFVADFGQQVGGGFNEVGSGPNLTAKMAPSVIDSLIDGFASCKHTDAADVLVLGTNNTSSTYTDGKTLAGDVNAAADYVSKHYGSSRIYMAGGIDAEDSFNPSPKGAESWVKGFIAATGHAWYDFGDSAGYQPSDYYFIAGGAKYRQGFALPEIYNTTPGANSSEWVKDTNVGNVKGKHRFYFAGVLTQYFSCHPGAKTISKPSGCMGAGNTDQTPVGAWKDMYAAIKSFQPSLPYSSDITYDTDYPKASPPPADNE